MNLASRMESTGAPGRVQISPATQALLKAAGKGNWASPRETEVAVKGKGNMQTVRTVVLVMVWMQQLQLDLISDPIVSLVFSVLVDGKR